MAIKMNPEGSAVRLRTHARKMLIIALAMPGFTVIISGCINEIIPKTFYGTNL
jgi:hypothetical protein